MIRLKNIEKIIGSFRENGDQRKHEISKLCQRMGAEVEVTQMRMVLGMKSISMSVMGLIIFGIVIFGIMNTLFMSIYERMFEFGVMRAVGTSKGSMRKLILLEAFSLSVISAVIGMILGLLITYAVSRTGIDYKGIEMAGGTMTELLYPILSVRQFVFYPLSIIVFTVIAGIYPAVAASKMTIAGAMRKSL